MNRKERDEFTESICKEYLPKLRVFVSLSKSSLHTPVDDVVHSILEKIVSQIHKYNKKYALSTWIYSIAGNHCRDQIRKDKRRWKYMTSFPENELTENRLPGPEELVIGNQEQERLRYLLSKLPVEQQQVLYLSTYEKLTLIEIGQIMDKPIGTIKTLGYKGRNWIRENWEVDV